MDETVFRLYFERYGEVEDAVVMYDHDNKRPRGFGFITFVAEDSVDQVSPCVPTRVSSHYRGGGIHCDWLQHLWLGPKTEMPGRLLMACTI